MGAVEVWSLRLTNDLVRRCLYTSSEEGSTRKEPAFVILVIFARGRCQSVSQAITNTENVRIPSYPFYQWLKIVLFQPQCKSTTDLVWLCRERLCMMNRCF